MEHHAGTQARCKGTRSKGSMKMTKLEQIYEGKAKKVFRTDDPAYCVVEYKDDATAFNGLKKGTILGKGAVNNCAGSSPARGTSPYLSFGQLPSIRR